MLWATAPPILNGLKTRLPPSPGAWSDTSIPRGCRPPRWHGERDGSVETGRAVQESHTRFAAAAVHAPDAHLRALCVSRCRRGLVHVEVWDVVELAVPRMPAHVQMWAAAPHMHCMHRCAGADRGSSTQELLEKSTARSVARGAGRTVVKKAGHATRVERALVWGSDMSEGLDGRARRTEVRGESTMCSSD